jgi:hypothetical protein
LEGRGAIVFTSSTNVAGLQVFDLRNPDDPRFSARCGLPAMGEDMYLLDAEHVVLLKKSLELVLVGEDWGRRWRNPCA